MIKVTIWNEFVQEQLCEETLEKFGFEGMPEDERNVPFYEKHGFRAVGRRKNYYEKPVEDAILMTLDLTES